MVFLWHLCNPQCWGFLQSFQKKDTFNDFRPWKFSLPIISQFCNKKSVTNSTFKINGWEKIRQQRKNERNSDIWQGGISKSLAEYVQRRVCFVNVQSSLHGNVVFSVCARMGNAAYIIFIMWNSISHLDAWYHLLFNISCGGCHGDRSSKKFR